MKKTTNEKCLKRGWRLLFLFIISTTLGAVLPIGSRFFYIVYPIWVLSGIGVFFCFWLLGVMPPKLTDIYNNSSDKKKEFWENHPLFILFIDEDFKG